MAVSKEEFLAGKVLLVDKPMEWSSFQAVNALKWPLRKQFDLGKRFKMGHAGTLDPLATGLLVVCTGKFTKRIPEIQGQQKEYTGAITLGSTTPSYDLETPVDKTYPIDHIRKEDILNAAASFLGEIDQLPPVFSAIKKEGKRLYEFARKGETVEIKPRKVEIFEFEIVGIQLPKVQFRIVCGKGTYIRSLAHDFGKTLGSGAHLSELRRTKIGDYHVDNASTPLEFKAWLSANTRTTHPKK